MSNRLNLVQGGASAYKIVLGGAASASEIHAAEELQAFLAQMSGATLPIVVDPDPVPDYAVFVGQSDAADAVLVIDYAALGDEGYTIQTVSPHVVIAGGRLRGTLYGVYRFLYDLGCRWYAPDCEVVPEHMHSIGLKPLAIIETPDYEYRAPHFIDAWDVDWAVRNCCNGGFPDTGIDPPDAEHGGHIRYALTPVGSRWVHTWAGLIPPGDGSPGTYFGDHPEWFSLVAGVRTTDQLCLTNADLVAELTANVRTWLNEGIEEDSIYSISQNDNLNYCHCDACQAVYDEEGSPSGLILQVVNEIAMQMKVEYAEFADRFTFDTLAYQWSQKPPSITVPADVIVRLCPIGQCVHHRHDLCDAPAWDGQSNREFLRDLHGWAEIAPKVYIWHYAANFVEPLLPMPDVEQLAHSIPFYYRAGVRGMFLQGTAPELGTIRPLFEHLKAYLAARLMWNTSADPVAIRREFFEVYYGNAWRLMEYIFVLLHKEARRGRVHGGCFDWIHGPFSFDADGTWPLYLTDRLLAAVDRHLTSAEMVVRRQPIYAARVAAVRAMFAWVEGEGP